MLTIRDLKRDFSNEQILLVLFSRLYFSTGDRSDVQNFIRDQKINWDLLYKIARVHGIRSFIYAVITKFEISIDDALAIKLKKTQQATLFNNLNQLQAIGKLTSDFEKLGITIIPYKGVVFAHSYYKDITLRESADVDFIVSKKDVKIVEDYFVKQDYIAVTTVPRPFLNYYTTFFKDIVYKQPDTAICIEMHWRLMERFYGHYPSYNFFSKHLVPYRVAGLSADKLSPTYDFLAVVSNHFVKDMGIRFKYFIDIACIISQERDSLDTATIFSCSRRYGFKKKLDAGLELTEQLLGVELIKRDRVALSSTFWKTTIQYPIYLPRLYINEAKFIKRSLQLQDSILNRLKFLLRCLFYVFIPTYVDINEFKLPIYLMPLLFVIRPIRLLYRVIHFKLHSLAEK
jgi:hypothetical protein